MGTVTKMPSPAMKKAIDKMYADLAWTPERRQGFNRRVCGCDHPRTGAEAGKVYMAVEARLTQLVRPHYSAFTALVRVLVQERYRMTPWERDTFVPDVIRKMCDPSAMSPAMIKKTREIAHKYGIPCGFPNFRELSQAYDREHEEQRLCQSKQP